MERNRRHKKQNLTFEQYCQLLEDLLKLTGRKVKKSKILSAKTFVL